MKLRLVWCYIPLLLEIISYLLYEKEFLNPSLICGYLLNAEVN